jgi:hypothetical protein
MVVKTSLKEDGIQASLDRLSKFFANGHDLDEMTLKKIEADLIQIEAKIQLFNRKTF